MKIRFCKLFVAPTLLASIHLVAAQGTAFTYQGRLSDGSSPANGTNYGMVFYLYDAPTNGNVLANSGITSVTVSNGLFTTPLNFGNVFDGNPRWMEITVQKNSGSFTTLTPRQPLTPIPYAITAQNLAGVVMNNILNGNGETIGGGNNNATSNLDSTIGGGANNVASGTASSVAGGYGNQATADYATVSGGEGNIASGSYSFAMNFRNTASGFASTAMGEENTASGEGATAMGYANSSIGVYSTVMGQGNSASGYASTVMGKANNANGQASTAIGENGTASGEASAAIGYYNAASGAAAIAMGAFAQAANNNTFVWADSQNPTFSSTTNDEFSVRAKNGVRLSDNTSLYFGNGTRQMINLYPGNLHAIGVQNSTTYFRSSSRFSWFQNGVHANGENDPGTGGGVLMTLTSGGLTVNGTVVSSSDRNVKQDFADVSSRAILDKVAHLPIQTWAYTNDPAVKHLGPVAQDFYATFNIGPDDKHISVVDEGGVALAAIQGLNQKLNEKLNEKDAEIQQLKQSVDELKVMVKQVAGK